jgi:hypothetical protein
MDNTQNAIAKIIKQCWDDDKFRARFVAQPNAVLKEHGVDVPADMEIKVVQNTENVQYLPIPVKPDELSDKALDGVAGGAGGTFSSSMAKKIEIRKLTGMGGPGTHDAGNYCIPYPC